MFIKVDYVNYAGQKQSMKTPKMYCSVKMQSCNNNASKMFRIFSCF